MYRKCNCCFFINEINEKALTFNCTLCSNNNLEETEEYPVPAAKGFLQQAEVNVFGSDEYTQYMFHELQSACLFLCSLYEILLESTLSDYLEKLSTPDVVCELIFESNQGQEKLTKMFKHLTSNSLKDLFLQNKEPLLYDYIKKIIKGRNHYIHGEYGALDNIETETLEYVCNNMVSGFVKIQNRLISGK